MITQCQHQGLDIAVKTWFSTTTQNILITNETLYNTNEDPLNYLTNGLLPCYNKRAMGDVANAEKTIELQRDSKGRFTEGRWKPGESGNPKGRQPGIKYISDYLRDALKETSKDGKSNAQLIADALIGLSKDPRMRGYVPAVKELLDRIEGKVAEKHLNLNITVTPEGIQVAQDRLLKANEDTKALLEKYPRKAGNSTPELT